MTGSKRSVLAVDARAIWGSGIGRYTREILKGLAALDGFELIRAVGLRADGPGVLGRPIRASGYA